MNVLMITSDAEVLRDGSPAQSLVIEQAKLANRLMVIVLNSRHRKSQARKVSDSLWIFPTNAWFPFMKPFQGLGVIRREIFYRNKLQAELIVANDPYAAAFVAIIASRRYGKPLHIYVPENIFSFYFVTRSPIALFKSVIARIFIGFAHSVSTANDSIREALVRRDPVYVERVTSVPSYVDVNAVQAEPVGEDLHMKYTQFRALLLVVAPLVGRHNIKVAIDALAKISEDRKYVGLVIVGSGPEKLLLKSYAVSRGVGSSVMFESPRVDMTSLYKSAFALLVTSPVDEYESTIEDAAAAGCVIISSAVGAARELIKNKENGYICDPNNPLGYVDAINTLLNNEKLRETMRARITEAARKYMKERSKDHVQSREKAWQTAIKNARGY